MKYKQLTNAGTNCSTHVDRVRRKRHHSNTAGRCNFKEIIEALGKSCTLLRA